MKTDSFVLLWKALFIVVFSAYFISQIQPLHRQVKSWYNLANSRDFYRALSWLKENSKEEDVVLTKWELGAQVVAHAERPVVATCKVYPSEVKEVAERYEDINDNFFGSKDERKAGFIAKKYNVRFILLGRKISKTKTILDRMSARQRLNGFRLVYTSGRYIIYEVISLQQNDPDAGH
jgi:uncharacterized membrane protein